MNISVIGIGKLGLCFALTLESSGFNVVGCDINPQYVQKINSKTLRSDEQGVEEKLKESNNFIATTDFEKTVQHSDMLFVVVATPSLESGRYDHSQVDSVVNKCISMGKQKQTKHLVVCCTTMPGYCDTVSDRLEKYNYTVSYNPEFIAQGTIIRDQSHPDMVLIGQANERVGDSLENIYKAHTHSNPRICRMSRTEAEICKISLNCFLTTKIAFANMVGDIARFSNCNPDVILKAIGSDTRVGNKYLGYGFGYGGPCFPRDNRALAIHADDVGVDAMISKASDRSNNRHLKYQLELFKKENSKDTKIVFDFVTYKKESTMIIESQQLEFAKLLAEEGYQVVLDERQSVYDQLDESFLEKVTCLRRNK